jgi:hypothetical protein
MGHKSRVLRIHSRVGQMLRYQFAESEPLIGFTLQDQAVVRCNLRFRNSFNATALLCSES